MNNATHEKPAHAVPLSHQNPGEEELTTPVNPVTGNEKSNLSDVLNRLDEIRYSPRAATIKAIMDYAHKKDKALH